MKMKDDLQKAAIVELQDSELKLIGGLLPVPPIWTLAGSGLGLYGALLGISYYAGYGAHALYDAVSK